MVPPWQVLQPHRKPTPDNLTDTRKYYKSGFPNTAEDHKETNALRALRSAEELSNAPGSDCMRALGQEASAPPLMST